LLTIDRSGKRDPMLMNCFRLGAPVLTAVVLRA